MSKTDTLFRKAQQYLRSGALLLEAGDYDSTASRSYFAMFYAAQAALLHRNGALPDQRGIRQSFIDQFVQNGPLPERAERMLTAIHELQQTADFSHQFAVTEEEAERAIQESEAFVNSVARLVRPSHAGGQAQSTAESDEQAASTRPQHDQADEEAPKKEEEPTSEKQSGS